MSEQTQAVRRHRRLRRIGVLAALVALVCLPGCVQRRMTIRSNPPGALVYVDNHEIGVTPVSTSFLYYGTREIRLVKDGYETLTVLQPMLPPWYQIPPLDFSRRIWSLANSETNVYSLTSCSPKWWFQRSSSSTGPSNCVPPQSPGGVMGAVPGSRILRLWLYSTSLPAAAPPPSPLSPNPMPH